MNNLVTVTCNLERNMMLLQAESIQKFLAPCTHYVVINEKNVNIEAWRDYLSPYYDKHKLIFLTQGDLFTDNDNLNGQLSQQVCKLEISKIIKDDYLIIDTKNFFIKPTSINEWDRYMGSAGLTHINDRILSSDVEKLRQDHVFVDCLKIYAQKLGYTTLPAFYFGPMTPFKIDYKALSVRKIDEYKDLILNDLDGNLLSAPSEFILYSFLVQPYIKPEVHAIQDPDLIKVQCAFYHNSEMFKTELMNDVVFNNIEYSNIKVWGIHRKLLETLDPSHIKKINEYLRHKGFKFQFQ